MKRLLVCLVFFTSSFAYSQAQKFIGVRGGLSIPNLYSNTDNEISKDYKSLLAGNAGFMYEAQLCKDNSRWYMMAELDFSRISAVRKGSQPIPPASSSAQMLYQGMRIPEGSYLYGDFSNQSVFDFISIPVMVKHYWGEGLRFYLAAGVAPTILLSATNTISTTSGSTLVTSSYNGNTIPDLRNGGKPITIPLDGSRNIKDDINAMNLSVIGAAGVTFPINKNYFFLDGRFDYGLFLLQKDTKNGTSHPGAGIVSVGYAITL